MTEFINLQAAYDYYNEYGRIKAWFDIRVLEGRRARGKTHVAGRQEDGSSIYHTCRCEDWIKVHVDDTSGRWYIEQFYDNHNHAMLDGLIWSHRSVKKGDLHQINSVRKVGLRLPTIFCAFANQSGDFKINNGA
ncbi:hypothetical protein Ahy_B04g069064 [Arachis hypogaea]|uniref:FAR1 domain-containing protein n=1 Tax=Arachis hypogaea TaxID=3818 RepID=A0A444ZBJ1_ARAHY|nr:hypothetical protein Ahy_B04g069064 [Arachis hypogaea]